MKKKFFQTLFLFFMILTLPFSTNMTGMQVQAAEEQTGIENPTYTLNTIDGTSVSTKANPNQTTMLVFGKTTCSKTTTTLRNIAASNWIGNSDIRVVFIECNLAPQDEMISYAQKIESDKISYCYDDSSDIIMRVMYQYGTLYQNTKISLTTPFIVLIDQNNRIQKFLEGSQTAEVLKSEIDKITGTGNPTDPTEPTPPTDTTGYENKEYIFTSIDGKNVSTKATPNQTTVLLFGRTTCGNTKATLKNIAGSDWIGNSDIRVIFAEYNFASQADTSAFAQQFGCDKITYCYDQNNYAGGIYSAMFKYLALFQEDTHITAPLTILINKNDRVQKCFQGTLTADALITEIKKINSSETTNPGPTTPEPEPSTPTPIKVGNVSNLKASSGTDNVKLSWKKVSKAEGYIVYQYKSSKWKKIGTTKASKASYTVKKLQSGSNYRFAVKAYRTQNKKQVLSKSYTSLYTATKPAAVNLKVTPGRGKATLKWKKVTGATGYTVCYKTSQKASWKKLKNVKTTSFTKKNLNSRKTYFFTVKAYKTYKGKTYTSSFQTKKVTIK